MQAVFENNRTVLGAGASAGMEVDLPPADDCTGAASVELQDVEQLTQPAGMASAAGGLSVAAVADPLASSAEHAPKTVGTKRYRGTVQRYHTPALLSWVHGNGCIAPDDPSSLPRRVQASLATQAEPFVAVRRPQSDVNLQEGFVLGVGVAVTFRVYVDGRGVGACDVSPA